MSCQRPLWEKYNLLEVQGQREALRKRLVMFDTSYFGTEAMVVVILFFDFSEKTLPRVSTN
jgi:hypothetical protein